MKSVLKNRPVTALAIVTSLLLAGVLISYITWDQKLIDSRSNAEVLRLLDRIKRSDAQIESEVFRIKAHMGLNFDRLTKHTRRLRNRVRRLERNLKKLGLLKRKPIRSHLERLKAGMKERLQAVENFKSNYSILRNSMVYLPGAIKKLSFGLGHSPQHSIFRTQLNGLLNEVLAINLGTGAGLDPKLKSSLEKVLASSHGIPTITNENRQEITQHISIVIDRSAKSVELADLLLKTQLTAMIDRIQSDFGKREAVEARYRDTYEVFFGVLSILLIVLVMGLIALLLKSNQKFKRIADLRTSELDKFFNISADMLCIMGVDGYFKRVNGAWTRVLGHTEDELLTIPHLDFVHPEDRKIEEKAGRQLNKAGATSMAYENRYRRADGSYRWLSWSAVYMPRLELIYAVARDITEQKKVAQMKNEFISTVSHELRTPLTSIRGSLGLVNSGAAGAIDDKPAELLEIAERNCERLIRLINDILDIEKIEAGKIDFDFQKFKVKDLVKAVIQANQSFADQFRVKFKVAEINARLELMGDFDRLNQVLTNLLSNAVKFSPKGEEVKVSVSLEGDDVKFQVTDHGPGISSKDQERIWEKFSQGDSTDTKTAQGTGLGLSISRSIVELHQGKIGLESRLGKGSTFWFVVPKRQKISDRVDEANDKDLFKAVKAV